MSLSISVEQEDLELLRSFSAKTGFPVSKLFEDYVTAICRTIRTTGLDKKKNFSKLDLLKLAAKGAMQST